MVLMMKRLNLRNKINDLIVKNIALNVKRDVVYKEFTLMSNIYNAKKALHLHMTSDQVLSPEKYNECCAMLQINLKMAYELNYFHAIIHKNSIYLHFLDLILLENYPYACPPFGVVPVKQYMDNILSNCDVRLETIDREILVLEGHIEDGEREIHVLTELIKAGVDEKGKAPVVPVAIPKVERTEAVIKQELFINGKGERVPAFMCFNFDNFNRQSKFKFTCGQEHPFKELKAELHKVPKFAWG